VEWSKLCLFSVIMPAKYVSSISPRFHYRRLTFCLLPLAAILESLDLPYLKSKFFPNSQMVCFLSLGVYLFSEFGAPGIISANILSL
jgi:hypothetical protein